MNTQAIFGLQFTLSLLVIGLLAKWVWVSLVGEAVATRSIILAHITACVSPHRHGLFGTRRCGAATPGRFRHSCRVRRFTNGYPCTVGAGRAAKRTGRRAGGGVALQRCRHDRPAQCLTSPRGSTELRRRLVHTDSVGAATSGDALHDLRPLT